MSNGSEMIEEAVLIKLMLEHEPHAVNQIECLRKHFAGKGSFGAFAPIKGERCGACNMSIAMARLQQAKSGFFIPCAHCARFLYWPEALSSKG